MGSEGDIRVLLVMDLVLSALFSTGVVWGLSFAGILTFSWPTVALSTLALTTLTYLVVLQ